MGILSGIFAGYFLVAGNLTSSTTLEKTPAKVMVTSFKRPTRQVIGFLPYWFINKEDTGVTKYITTLTYFGLTIDTDGTILKFSKPNETEPGWHTLNSGKVAQFLDAAKSNHLTTSLLVFKANNETIDTLISDPITHAQNLLNGVVPIMKQYGFTDLNLDIESTKEASPDARAKFTQFAKTVKRGLEKENAGSLTVEVSASDFIKNKLINPSALKDIADYVVIMAYDYHFPGSIVTGPVAPLSGGGVTYEYDTKIAVEKALQVIPPEKIILGIPLYGYEWETITDTNHSAIIPGTSVVVSNERAENLLSTCSTCTNIFDVEAQEVLLTFRDEKTGSFHQIFYPDVRSTQSKVNYAKENKLGGLALWALGYEGETILNPLENYIRPTASKK